MYKKPTLRKQCGFLVTRTAYSALSNLSTALGGLRQLFRARDFTVRHALRLGCFDEPTGSHPCMITILVKKLTHTA